MKNKFRQFLKKKLVVNQINFTIDAIMNIKKRNFEKKFVKLNEMRDSAFDKRMKMKKNMTRKTTKKKVSSESKDLIKLRRLSQNNQKSHKLKSRWENSYRVKSVSANKKSVWLKDLNIDQTKKKFHVNHIFLFLKRNRYQDETQKWKSIKEINS